MLGCLFAISEDWKAARGAMGSCQPKYQADPDLSGITDARVPTLKVCTMSSEGKVEMQEAVRQRWLKDPVRGPDWKVRVPNFDNVFPPGLEPKPLVVDPKIDLGVVHPPVEPVEEETLNEPPPSMTLDEFKEKYPTVTATVSLNFGHTVTCYVCETKCFVMSGVKFKLPGLKSPDAKPAFLYAGGTWLSESSKDRHILTVFFVELHVAGAGLLGKSCEPEQGGRVPLAWARRLCALLPWLSFCDQVVFEESSDKGSTDSPPMPLKQLMLNMERQGILDLSVTGHSVSRPPSVLRGEEADRQVVFFVEMLVQVRGGTQRF